MSSAIVGQVGEGLGSQLDATMGGADVGLDDPLRGTGDRLTAVGVLQQSLHRPAQVVLSIKRLVMGA